MAASDPNEQSVESYHCTLLWHVPLGHGTSQIHTLVRSPRFLHYFGPMALGGVNHIETSTSVRNLYLYSNMALCMYEALCVVNFNVTVPPS